MSESLRRHVLLGSALAVSALVVGMAFNPVPHSGGDNAGYLALAYSLVTDGTYTEVFDPQRLAHTKYPPVFPAILAVLMWLGARTWVAFKTTAAVATIASVGLTFLWAERRLGSVPAFGVSVLLALSSAVVYYSHWILSDPVFVAFTLGALVALDRASDDGARPWWVALGVAAAGLAFFTRSAGLPLVVTLVAWLARERRWRALAGTAVTVGVPALAWWWRARGGAASYAAEFWMVDPYRPELGTVGVLGLVPRAFTNLTAYVATHGPGGIVGQETPALAILGLALTVAALAGWALTARERIGPAELFFALYAGLILLWPAVWAGDRFALPLYPIVFVYGAVALRRATGRMPPPAGALVTAAAVLVLALPAGRDWLLARREAVVCAQAARASGPFACYGPRIAAFAEAATWAGHGLPAGSAVLSRKPRHFFVLSGVPSRTFPFDEDPDVLLSLADSLGARYVLFDQWDAQATRYVGAAVGARPGAFCYVVAFGDASTGAAQLLGISPPSERDSGGVQAPSAVEIAQCPNGYVRPGAAEAYPSPARPGRVPLLDGLDS